MFTHTVNVASRKDGSIFQRDKVNRGSGHILTIKNEPILSNTSSCRIVCACIEFPQILTGDSNGSVYLYHLRDNRFKSLAKIGSCCTTIAFANALHPYRDVLVSSSSCLFFVLQSSTGKVVAKLSGHRSPIYHISVDKKCYVAVTSSSRQTMVWDLNRLTLQHEIVLPLDIDLVKSLLVPPYESIVSLYKKDQIYFWNHLTRKYTQSFQINTHKMDCSLVVNTADVSGDGKLLLLGGHANWLLCWKINTLNECATQPMVISLSKHIRSVLKLSFVNLSFQQNLSIYTALVLSQDGILYLYEIITNKLLRKIQDLDDRFSNLQCSMDSDKVVAITTKGFVQVYFIEELVSQEDFGQSDCWLNANVKPHGIDETITEDLLKGDGNDRVRIIVGDGLKLLFILKRERDPIKVKPQTIEKLRGILREYGKFPDKYRFIIWSNFLDLFDNSIHFKALFRMGIHDAFKDFDERYPIVNPILSRANKTILSMLAWWCPQLLQIDCIPRLVFPFVKLLHHNLHLCFEVLVAFLCNWSSRWFLEYPYLNSQIMMACESLLSEHDRNLYFNMARWNITTKDYAWSLISHLFSEVLDDKAWITLFDHLVANSTDFLLYLVVSFSIVMKKKLLHCQSRDSILCIYTNLSANVDISMKLISKAYQLYQSTSYPVREQIRAAIGDTKFSSHNREYPTLNFFPTLMFDFETEREIARAKLGEMKTRQEIILNQQSVDLTSQNFVRFEGNLSEAFDSGACAFSNANDVPRGIIQPLEVTRNVLSTRCHLAHLQHQKNHPNRLFNQN